MTAPWVALIPTDLSVADGHMSQGVTHWVHRRNSSVGRGRRRDPLPNGGGSQAASTPCQILNDNANAVHLLQLDAPQI